MKADMQQLLRKFEKFEPEWDEHRAASKVAMEETKSIHSHVTHVKDHIEHLDQLPVIASALNNIQDRLIKVVLIFILVIAGLFMVVILKDSRTSVRMPGGFELNNKTEESK